MNRMELDAFVGEVGFNCDMKGGDDKWRTNTQSLITQKVRQLSACSSRTKMFAVRTASSYITTEDLAGANVNCSMAK